MLRLLTLDSEHPTSVLNCISRAREGARTVRDVFSGEMWEAINTFHLGLLQRNVSAAVQTGPYSVYAYVRERCGLFWGVTGRTMLRDEAHAFLQAGAAIESADMVLRMLRVALPADAADGEEHLRDGQALALLQAVGGFQAYRRSVPAPPNARPVARFLLFERDYPDSVAFSIEALHNALTAADPSYRSSPAGPAAVAPDGRSRLPRPHRQGGRHHRRQHARHRPDGAARRSMPTSPPRYFGDARCSPQRARSPYELRHPLPDRVPLQRPGHGQPERAARQARDASPRRASRTSSCASSPSRG